MEISDSVYDISKSSRSFFSHRKRHIDKIYWEQRLHQAGIIISVGSPSNHSCNNKNLEHLLHQTGVHVAVGSSSKNSYEKETYEYNIKNGNSHSTFEEDTEDTKVFTETSSRRYQENTCLLNIDENLKSNDWRATETIPFQDNIEMHGYGLIYEALSLEEKMSLSDVNMPLRHFRAEKGNIEKATLRLKAALQYQKQVGTIAIKQCFQDGGNLDVRRMLAKENESGKIYVRGYDKGGRAIIYIRSHLENTHNEGDNIKHLIYNLERAIACTERKSRETKFVCIIDMSKFTLKNSPSLSLTKETMNILQDYYPERAFRFYICNAPASFRFFWNVASQFIHPINKEKIKFCSGSSGLKTLSRDFDIESIEKFVGGLKEFRAFDSEEYLHGRFDYAFAEDEENTDRIKDIYEPLSNSQNL